MLSAEDQPVRVEAAGIGAAADWDTLRSPQTNVGYARRGRAGQGTVEDESAMLEAGGGSIAYRFQARDLTSC